MNKNTIVIYHQLKIGGGLTYLKHLKTEFKKLGFKVLVIKPKKYIKRNFLHTIIYSVFLLTYENYKISQKVRNINPEVFIVFPSWITQAPSILLFANKLSTYYFFLESKREFYENVSFNHNTLRQQIIRFLLLPIRLVDYFSTRNSKHIVVISHYSKYVLKKIYKKETNYVVHPGQKQIKIISNNKKLTKRLLSIGLLSKLKGHMFTIKQFSNSIHQNKYALSIIGNNSHESNVILSEAIGRNITIHRNLKDENKIKYMQNSSIYFSNQEYEPYGLSTLEAANSKIFVLGKNQGGTPEIVQSGVNGFLYPDSILMAINILNSIFPNVIKKTYQTCIIDWEYTAQILIKIFKIGDLHNTFNKK